jgi:plant 3beta-hydroxysteroid-4alpha-carboxylate 3-dehydrogenase
MKQMQLKGLKQNPTSCAPQSVLFPTSVPLPPHPAMATTEPAPAPAKPACAVTFGRSTLLGRHLAAALAASGRWSAVAVLDPSPSPPSAPSDSPLLRHLAINLSHPEALEPALAGASAVFHVDAMTAASVSDGSFRSLHRLAVEGTRRLLASCCVIGVGRVVYTGSADVVAAGARDVINADEDAAPYPDKVC